MKITDLLEAATPHNWKPIIQQPDGATVVHLLMRDGHDIPHNANIQELPDKKLVNPATIDDTFGIIYVMSGVPFSTNNTKLTRWYYARLGEDGINYELYTIRISANNLKNRKHGAGSTEVADESISKEHLEKYYAGPSDHTWLITWPEEETPNKQFDRKAAKALPTTVEQLAKRLEPLKLSIITQAALQLKRSDPKAAQVVAAIKSAMSNKQGSISLVRYSSTPVELKITDWWIARINALLQNSLSTTRKTVTAARFRPLDDPDFPKGLFAKLPEELVKQIATWGKISQYSITDNT